MVSLRHHFKDPLIVSLGITLGLHLVFFIGICVLMAEEYYTLGSYGCRHHRRHYKHHGIYQQPGGVAAPIQQQAVPEPDERFVTRDEDTNTYRLSPDLVKAFKALDIAPVVLRVKKSKMAKKSEIIKEKPVLKAKKQKIQAAKKSDKKQKALAHPVYSEEKKIPAVASKKSAPVSQQGSSQGVSAGTKLNAHSESKKQSTDTKSTPSIQNYVQAKPQSVSPAAVTVLPKPAVVNVQQAVVADEEEIAPTTNVVTESESDDNDTYDDDEGDGSDEDALFETDTLSLAASDARGGMLSARQSKAAKQLSEHMVKQWRPPAGCHDASPVHVEVAVQHDGRIDSKFIKTSSMPILNFAVKRMVAQLTTKAVQDMMDSARGTKLILIFKG